MILLDGHTLNRKIQFRPESQSLTLEERKGQSSLTVGDGAPEIQVGDWMRDDTEPGAGTVWRVRTVERNYHGPDTSTRTIQLEHIVNTLRDGVIFGEMTWDSISASGAMGAVLALTGGLWQLGDFEPENVSWPYKFNACTWMDALENITRTLADAWWDYDLSSLPFTLHIRSLSNGTDSEMRMSRNISGIRRTVDRSRMYTRFYPIGLNDLHITGDYVSRNEAVYGVCSRIETNQAIDSEAELRSWANDRLKRHCEPAVTVTVSGLDLSRDTGEDLDALRLNRLCRVPLPEFGTTILEKVCRLQWPDKIKNPEKFNVTLANEKEDIASIFSQQAAGSEASRSGGGRGAKKKIEEDHAWFVDTSDHVAMVAEAIIGQGPDGVDWSRVAALSVDGYGIHGRVTRAEGYMVTMSSRMDMDEERLGVAFDTIDSVRSEFEMTAESLRVAFTNDIDSVRSEMTMTAESLRVTFENDVDSVRSEISVTAQSLRTSFSNTVTSVRSEISQQADRISLVVEGTGENAHIKSAAIVAVVKSNRSQLELTAEDIIMDGTIMLNDVLVARTNSLQIKKPIILASDLSGGVTISSSDITVGGNSIANPIMSVTDGAYVNNSKTVTFTHADGTPETITFSRATSLSPAWSGATCTVTATPQESTCSVTMYQAIEGTVNPGATVYAKMYHTNPSVAANQVGNATEMTLVEKASAKKVELQVNTLVKGSISTESTYAAGWADCYAAIEVSPDEDVLLDYSDSQQILVKAKATPGASLSNLSNFTISSKASDKKDAAVAFDQWITTAQNEIGASNVIRFKNSTSGSTQTATRAVYLTQDSSFVSNKKTVYMRDETSSGTIVGKIQVDASSIYTAGQQSIINAGGALSQSGNCTDLAVNRYVTTLTVTNAVVNPGIWLIDLNDTRIPASELAACTTYNGQLGYGAGYTLGYGDDSVVHIYTGYWTAPPDRYSDGYGDGYSAGYDDGADSASHSPSASITTGWTGSISGRQNLGSASASSLARTYILINASCGGETKKYYFTVN